MSLPESWGAVDNWTANAVAVVFSLANHDEPAAPQYESERGSWRRCVLCDGESRSESGPVAHVDGCPWIRARLLAGEVRR